MTSAKQSKQTDRQASIRWCNSCQALVYTEWGECKGHQGLSTDEPKPPWFGCGAVIIPAPKPKVFSHSCVDVPSIPAGAMSHDTFIQIINSIGLRERKQKVNGSSTATPMGEYAVVPHTAECPLCQKAQAYGIYVVTMKETDAKAEWSQLELACAQCATSRIPFRQAHGVLTVKHAVLFAVIECHAHNAWTITPVTHAE
jgi:hypothetical protein